jgi:hypothetical protein
MANTFVKSALLGLSLSIAFAVPAQAETATETATIDQVSTIAQLEGTSTVGLDQVTSVSQLSDVKPTDWAFQALQSLVERYGCIAGYPDKTYRGNRSLTRYEFAAGLNACMDRVNELISASTADMAKREDLESLRKLQEEFAAELATLRGRVDALEARTSTLEKQQFSTTTKLRGEVIFSVSGALGDKIALPGTGNPTAATPDVAEETTFSNRVRLGLATSFTGKDTLLTRLQARNIPNLGATGVTNTNMARLSYEGGGLPDNAVRVDKLYYRFPFNDKATVTIDAVGGEFYANMNNFNPLLASDGNGAISRFGRFNPIYRGGSSGTGSGAGVTLNYAFTDKITFSAGYLADNASSTGPDLGLFNGANAAIAQLAFKPSPKIDLGLTYTRTYDNSTNVAVTGATGSGFANAPFGQGAATTADNFGLQGSFKFSPQAVVSGWVGYTSASQKSGLLAGRDADIWNWAVTLAFPDLGKKGNLAGIIVGMPPKVTNHSTAALEDDDTSFHIEALYRYQVTDKIAVTPGFLVILNPQHNSNNDTIYVGTVRTTFSF